MSEWWADGQVIDKDEERRKENKMKRKRWKWKKNERIRENERIRGGEITGGLILLDSLAMEKERLNIHDDLLLSTWSGKRKQKIEIEDQRKSRSRISLEIYSTYKAKQDI